MEKIITLLKEKNEYLEQYYDLNETEIANFSQAKFETLEEFYQSRERVLEKVREIDVKIEVIQAEPTVVEPTHEQRHHVEDLLAIKDDLVKEILTQDLHILSLVEKAKSDLIRELQVVRHNRKAVGAYRSRNVIPLLDEEL